jgi:TRAP-type C4-dicarboxylate transport system permease large subunit
MFALLIRHASDTWRGRALAACAAAAMIAAVVLLPVEPDRLVVPYVFLLIVGCLMDIFSAIVVVVPIMLPIGVAFGVDPVSCVPRIRVLRPNQVRQSHHY